MSQALYIVDYSTIPQILIPDGSNFEIIVQQNYEIPPIGNDETLTLWLADIVGTECLLLSRLEVQTIEELDSGNLIYTGSHERSLHFRSVSSRNQSYVISSIDTKFLGPKKFYYLDDSQITEFNLIERNAWNSSYSPPYERVIVQALHKWNLIHTNDACMTVIEAISLVNSIFTQSDLVRHVKDSYEVSPLVSNVMKLLEASNRTKDWKIDDVLTITTKRYNGSARIDIDTLLRPFGSVDLLPRHFRWSSVNPGMLDWEASRIKLERAEKKHQEILKGCHDYFIRIGLNPMMNRNVDLALILKDRLSIFEIKSATLDNFRSQALKGIIQVLEYSHCFELADFKVFRKCLVIECPFDFDDCEYYINFTKTLGVELVFYKDYYEWPLKAENIL